jgi:hypothetical protein
MFVGNAEKVYMLDKAQSNVAQINNHPAWGSVWQVFSTSVLTTDSYVDIFI